MFGRTSFNRTYFNRSGESLGMYCIIKSEYDFETRDIHIRMAMRGPTIDARYGTDFGRLWVFVPIRGVEMASQYDLSGCTLGLLIPLQLTLGGEYELIPSTLRDSTTEEFTLEGLNLAPGQVVTIDTDTIDVLVDGISDVDVWASGGTFFQLGEGRNILYIHDNAQSRALQVTILWADRYL